MTTSTIDISEARKQFNRFDEMVSGGRIIKVTRHGKEAFAIVDVEFLAAMLETFAIMEDPEAFRMLLESLEDVKAGRLIDHEDVKRELL